MDDEIKALRAQWEKEKEHAANVAFCSDVLDGVIDVALQAARYRHLKFGAYRPKPSAQGDLSLRDALNEAVGQKGFWLLCLGFFVCGFQVVFFGEIFSH